VPSRWTGKGRKEAEDHRGRHAVRGVTRMVAHNYWKKEGGSASRWQLRFEDDDITEPVFKSGSQDGMVAWRKGGESDRAIGKLTSGDVCKAKRLFSLTPGILLSSLRIALVAMSFSPEGGISGNLFIPWRSSPPQGLLFSESSGSVHLPSLARGHLWLLTGISNRGVKKRPAHRGGPGVNGFRTLACGCSTTLNIDREGGEKEYA